jgi:UPF0755 protein
VSVDDVGQGPIGAPGPAADEVGPAADEVGPAADEVGPAADEAHHEGLVHSIFGHHEDHVPVASTNHAPRGDRHRRSAGRRRRRRGRVISLLAFVLIVVLAAGGFVIVKSVLNGLKVKDYSGDGTGSIVIQVKVGDQSDDIAATLASKDVVESRQAFQDAARSSGRSSDFQAGFFAMHLKMSGKAAVAQLLNPSSRVQSTLLIKEGETTFAVLPALAATLHVALATVQAAAKDIPNLGIPSGYTPVTSAEGFLYPATYPFDPGTSPADALQQLTTAFGKEVNTLKFAAAAKAVHLTPYSALIVASLIQMESKYYATDGPKVARVVFNRLAADMPLQFDSSSAYYALLTGEKTVTYKENTPYNLRIRKGLPPTPIDNPGEEALTAAVTPATGNWLYFVNDDAEGHLGFYNTATDFNAAVAVCLKNHWGCT